MKEFKDVFEADKITPLAGAPMQIHLKQDDPSYRPIRVSHHKKVPLHLQEQADKTLKWFLDSGVIQEPLNQRTYHADDFVLALIVVVITH
jgi:hypothetical protein